MAYNMLLKRCVDCPSDKPWFNGIKCASCPEQKYWNEDKLICD